jgi:hypothetical protein
VPDYEDAPYREYGLYVGFVDDVVDSAKQGRVKVRIPGVLEPAKLADVLMLGSPFSNGCFMVPAVGSQVLVGFMQGELDSPVVLGGISPPAGAGGFRADLTTAQLPRFATFENGEFMLVLGATNTPAPYAMLASRSEPRISVILNLENRSVEVRGPTSVHVSSDGLLQLTAPVIQIGNRLVVQDGTPI